MKTRIPLLFAASAALLCGQAERRTYMFDHEGRRVPWTASSSTNGASTESAAAMNGGAAPLEQIEERLLSDSGGVRKVEKIIRRFAPDGSRLPAERVVTETAELGGGRQAATTTVYRGDLNGNLAVAERTVSQTNPAGSATTMVSDQVERPTINGSFEVVLKKETRLTTTDKTSERDQTSYRPDGNGRWVERDRLVERTTKEGEKVVVQTAEYGTATTGQMALSRQVVSTTTPTPDGEMTVSDIYAISSPGRFAEGPLQFTERQILTKTVRTGGTTESLSVQKAATDGTSRLTEPRKISETVCTGKCAPAKP